MSTTTSLQDTLMHSPAATHWERIGIKPHHGICTPLSSLYTNKSCGIGEYLDLLPLIDWCASQKLDVIQLLPLNDSGYDPSPYNSLSSCALNPVYLSLQSLDRIQSHPELMGTLQDLARCNQSPRVAYPEIRRQKSFLLKQYCSLEGQQIRQSSGYQEFMQKNSWIQTYALFKTFKELHNGSDWRYWPLEHVPKSKEQLENLFKNFKESTEVYCTIQYLCYLQMNQVRAYAESKGVFLKGDIPILLSPDSADVWERPDLFRLDYSAGAPPDMYAAEGQYWGFPLFNWEAMEKENNAWWKQRLQYAQHFYHLYRIDHIIGLFRIWAIPRGKKPAEGRYLPEKKEEWLAQGEKNLKMLLSASTMLPIAEDLGIVPPELRECLRNNGVCGTKVLRWERNWDGDRQFIPPNTFQPISMTTVSTHDSEPLALWWVNEVEDAKEYSREKGWEYTPFLLPAHQKEILYESHHSGSLFHINLLLEYLGIIPDLHSDLLEDERINTPGLISDRNWTYRYADSVERIASHPELKELMKFLIQDK